MSYSIKKSKFKIYYGQRKASVLKQTCICHKNLKLLQPTLDCQHLHNRQLIYFNRIIRENAICFKSPSNMGSAFTSFTGCDSDQCTRITQCNEVLLPWFLPALPLLIYLVILNVPNEIIGQRSPNITGLTVIIKVQQAHALWGIHEWNFIIQVHYFLYCSLVLLE